MPVSHLLAGPGVLLAVIGGGFTGLVSAGPPEISNIQLGIVGSTVESRIGESIPGEELMEKIPGTVFALVALLVPGLEREVLGGS